MIKNIILSLAAICCFQHIAAQVLEGKVLNHTGDIPLSNVVVSDLNSSQVKITNEEGNFDFNEINYPVRLKFSRLGFKSKIITISKLTPGLEIYLEEEIGMLSEVVLRSSNISQGIRTTPAAVGLISQNDLKRNDNFNLVQSFNYVPGVYVNQGALNTNKINIRGIGSRAQYSTNRIKAYFNGIPLTTVEGELTLDDFDPEFLERIEIFKGPVSSLFGAGLGGSINLYTEKNPRNQKSITTEFNYGSFDTRKSRAKITYAKDSLNISLNYNNLQSDSFRQNGEYDRISMMGNANLLTKSGDYWSLFFSVTNLKAFIPSSLSKTDFLNNPEKAAFTWYQSTGYESYDKNIMGISYAHNFSENFKNQTSLFYNSRDGYEPRPFDILDEERKSIGIRTRFNYQTSVFSKPSEVSFGAETMWENHKTGTFENLYEQAEERRSVQGEQLSLNHQDRNYINIFAQINVEVSKKLLAEAGINFNTTAYQLDDKFEDEIDQTGKYRFDGIFSPRLGISYQAWENKTFYASVSHGFSTPTVAETLTPEGLINTNLKTETGLNYEIGFKGSWLENQLYTELNLYSIQIRNLLVARRVEQDQYVGVNAGKSNHNGVEFTSVYRTSFAEDIQLRLFLNSNFNFFKFERFVDLGEDYSGNEIPGTPDYMISPGVEVENRNLTANINYQAFGKVALNDLNSEYTDAYQLLNFKMKYDWRFSNMFDIEFNFGINNMLDKNYAASVVTNAIGFGGAQPRYYYPGTPRNYYGGLSLKFEL